MTAKEIMTIDRSVVLKDAQARWADARRRGWNSPYYPDRWTWGRCLSLAWSAERQKRDAELKRAIEAYIFRAATR